MQRAQTSFPKNFYVKFCYKRGSQMQMWYGTIPYYAGFDTKIEAEQHADVLRETSEIAICTITIQSKVTLNK